MPVPWLPPGEPESFPDPETALEYPNGLLAASWELEPERILAAYRRGIFPWYSDEEPVLWWTPDPRMVLYPAKIRVSRSLRKTLRNRGFRVSHDQAFNRVITHCAETPRPGQDGTWITAEILDAYTELHHRGHAHSLEVWLEDQLVGGLYGIHLGRIFFGESMFSLERDASKVALVSLAAAAQRAGYALIDCQVYTSHLASLGAVEIPRRQFGEIVAHSTRAEPAADLWSETWR